MRGETLAEIEFRDVTRSYPGGVTALKGLNLTVADGEFLILVGLELNDFIVATILFIQGVSLILGLFFLVMRMGTLLLSFRIRQFQAILRLTEEINRFQMISAIMHINSNTY